MNNRNSVIRLGLVLTLVSLLAGCVKRELLVEPGERVRIVFDWKNLTDPALIPGSMQLWFYGPDNTVFSRLGSATAFDGTLPAGNYRVIFYNPDASGVNFKNLDRYDEAETNLLPAEDGTVSQPSDIYGTALPEYTVTPGQSNAVTVVPNISVHTLQLRVKAGGDQSAAVSAMQACMEGVATGLNLSTGQPLPGGNGKVNQPLSATGEDFECTFTLFGGDEQNNGKLTLTLQMSDGSERKVSIDITETLQKINQQQTTVPLFIDMTLDITKIDGVFVGTIQDWEYKTGETVVN